MNFRFVRILMPMLPLMFIPITSAITDEAKMINQYCFEHATDILAGTNPIDDLRNAGLIYGYEGFTCDSFRDMIEQSAIDEQNHDFLCSIIPEC